MAAVCAATSMFMSWLSAAGTCVYRQTHRIDPCLAWECRRTSARGSESHELSEGGDEKKKRDSRKSGFLNLIKSRSKCERPPTVLMTEEPSSPKGAVRGSAVDTPRKEPKATEHNGNSDRAEEIKTPDSIDESLGEEAGHTERGDSRSSPQAGRRYGVQVMGSSLLAEMKAKQEQRAACAQKVRAVSSSCMHVGCHLLFTEFRNTEK